MGKTHYTVYKTTNLVNGKIYIGVHRTEDLDDNYLGSGSYFLKSVRKYGIDNFKKEILFDFDNEKEMLNKERELVNENFIERNTNYNLLVGGGPGGRTPSIELRKKMSESSKGQIAWNKGKTGIYSEETKRKISNSLKGNPGYWKGKTRSDEAKRKMSEAKKGKSSWNKGTSPSEETKKKISESLMGNPGYWIGKNLSEETKEKISKGNKGKIRSEELKLRISKKLSGKNHYLYGKHLSDEIKLKVSNTLKRKYRMKKIINILNNRVIQLQGA